MNKAMTGHRFGLPAGTSHVLKEDKMTTRLRQLFHKLGTARATVLITVLSIVLSVIISASVHLMYRGEYSAGSSVLIAAIIPALIAPPLSYIILDLLNHLDKSEHERSLLVAELQNALARIKVLDGLLPICAACKKIRDEDGHWHQIENYIRARSAAEFSHGLCPDCAQKLYPEYMLEND
jgi:hypothetical protein